MTTMTFRGSHTYVWDTAKPLGQGATSMVYMGRNKKTGDEVAVKVFNAQSYQRSFSVQAREFEVMKKLQHENVVKLLAVEEEIPSRTKVIIMEFCTHGSLYSLLDVPENNMGLAEDEFLRVLEHVTAGVKHLRDNNIIHRDIKPGNILRSLAADGSSVFKLTDFGAARELQQDEEFMSLYGTDEYLHPDMYEKAVLRRPKGQQFGVYVDLWSLGVTFYHAVAGTLPFRPYGGRQNKETMHLITAQKEPGVISGVQSREGGPITWSRDLPLTCRLSRGLKQLITPFLALLLEKEPSKAISFDEYFAGVADIISRRAYHLFCPSSFSSLTVYAKQASDMSQLRQLITEQTEIPGGAQLLLHAGKVLNVESREPVCTFLRQVSQDNPIFVFNKLPEYKPLYKPAVGLFPEIPKETNVERDYPLSKKCCAVMHSIRHAVKTIIQNNKLMNTSVTMYSNYITHRSNQLQLSMGHATRSCRDIVGWREQFFSILGIQMSLLQALTRCNPRVTTVDMASRANVLQTLHQTGNRECLQLSNLIQDKMDKAVNMLQDMMTGQSLDTSWNPDVGCLPSDRCDEQMDVFVQKMQKIMSSFRENRSKRGLSNNDEQIHRFDKNRVNELVIKAQSLLEDHCFKKSYALFAAFKQGYSKAVQIHDAGERLEISLSDILHQQTRLSDKLRVAGRQCVDLCKTCLDTVEGQGERMGNGDLDSNGDSNWSCVQNSSREEKLGGMFDSIQNARASMEEVRDMLIENSSIIERFNSLQEGQEEDRSWEVVP